MPRYLPQCLAVRWTIQFFSADEGTLQLFERQRQRNDELENEKEELKKGKEKQNLKLKRGGGRLTCFGEFAAKAECHENYEKGCMDLEFFCPSHKGDIPFVCKEAATELKKIRLAAHLDWEDFWGSVCRLAFNFKDWIEDNAREIHLLNSSDYERVGEMILVVNSRGIHYPKLGFGNDPEVEIDTWTAKTEQVVSEIQRWLNDYHENNEKFRKTLLETADTALRGTYEDEVLTTSRWMVGGHDRGSRSASQFSDDRRAVSKITLREAVELE
ncbi:hypothetical protein MBM_02901 [Drepanopeziza brunnea f. sp. 'multigermtubi' MB_m1]|uniref:Uncharacterized protein n=1 Tax=Marssonina brunnea f. sp. multigermtubi (strain MB_m1) TaxID=1072389 RepID=K1Y0P3_MARBU|nr:uncharacterized protein MBM_02901 [Drepanopeziza brunnea f. sp. 'multigermtubi' MB_m1]EKD18659.1 hypothetical protein MBM_02901 [Drepanopeziza brunnea f. sp. 'multigermtubi' MB_m1]